MSVNDLLTLSGATIVITILVEVIKRALAFNDVQTTRFGPVLSIGIGLIILVAAAASQHADIAAAALTGLIAGASSSGVYSFAKAGGGLQSAAPFTNTLTKTVVTDTPVVNSVSANSAPKVSPPVE